MLVFSERELRCVAFADGHRLSIAKASEATFVASDWLSLRETLVVVVDFRRRGVVVSPVLLLLSPSSCLSRRSPDASSGPGRTWLRVPFERRLLATSANQERSFYSARHASVLYLTSPQHSLYCTVQCHLYCTVLYTPILYSTVHVYSINSLFLFSVHDMCATLKLGEVWAKSKNTPPH